jgi:D-alanyl-lipoteichoic acid acyltransferase DltB (MBOAT superfamily)
MSFTSLTFAAFFALLLLLYWQIRHRDAQNVLLLGASYLFYGWIHPWYALLLGFSTAADFLLARGISRNPAHARNLLSLSLLLNLGTLALFKYYNFFNQALAERLGADWLLVSIALPAGLSFYTLKKIAYLVDVSRGSLHPAPNFLHFALYVSFFPQIVAGPIERAQRLLPQIEKPRHWQSAHLQEALPLLVMGFFKKIVVADTIKSIADRVYSLDEPSKIILLAGTLAFTLQIFADFSAYTDLSRGLARLLGFETSPNFNAPYRALTPADFWNRWHISLSTFLRDYVFYPLRRAILRHKNLPAWLAQAIPPLLTMFISGLWHGAGWNYLLWGVYYGLLSLLYQSAGISGIVQGKCSQAKRLGLWALMFGFIVFGWGLFRAGSLSWFFHILLHSPFLAQPQDLLMCLVIASMLAFYSLPLLIQPLSRPGSWAQATYFAGLTILTILYTNSGNPDFIYFQF